MNDKLKTIVFIGIIICIIIGIYFFWEKEMPATDTSQIKKATVSQGQKAKKKLNLVKDADLHDIYLAEAVSGVCGRVLFSSSWCDRCGLWLCKWERRNNQV